MHPAHHEAALAAFFRRHDIAIPAEPAGTAAFARMGCVLLAARLLRENRFVIRSIGGGLHFRIGATEFHAEDRNLAGISAVLATLFEEIEAGRAPDWNGSQIDRMALLLRRAATSGLPADADMLAREGIRQHLIAESGFEAAQLAEAMAVAERTFLAHARARGFGDDHNSEAA